MKINFILSMTPLGWLTFLIWPLITSILILASSEKFENKNYAIATGIVGLLIGPMLVGFIMGFFLKINK